LITDWVGSGEGEVEAQSLKLISVMVRMKGELMWELQQDDPEFSDGPFDRKVRPGGNVK